MSRRATPGLRARLSMGLSALLLASASVAANPVAAECPGLDPWPSFTDASRSARTIVLGEVVESLQDDSADNAVWFRVRVDEVLRGKATPIIEIKLLYSGVPLKFCSDSILRVRMADRIAFAFDARISGVAGPVTTVAWVREGLAPTPPPAPGSPNEQVESVRDFLVPGVERLAVSEVRALAALPATNTEQVGAHQAALGPWPALATLVVAAGLLGFVVVLRRRQRPQSA